MSTLKGNPLRKAFSLVELLIVIMIVGLIYFLGFSSISIGKSKPKPLTPLNLKESIVKSKLFNGHATFMCTNKCKKCYLRQGISSPFKPYSSPIDLTDITVYTLDERESLREMEYERYKDEKVCLVIDFYDNGSSTQLILKNEEAAYFLPSFFGKAKQFDSVSDAKTYWLKDVKTVSDAGGYY
ncbi:MAG: Prepilin-type cleavage/methylation domain-containing protein [uncultured Sulfurovum sp.]|uniref:Prepilin-type cleavage/methylation domain-containing protein n=1 Tax=uncultured Sulfurovum sp. TaxID=269237 RepID=A0A6S6U4U2_9BACT|nr:MAG: Prepilin-type cleavage/methylation domain-containing protein [uncultured Sulfurovum sp.]